MSGHIQVPSLRRRKNESTKKIIPRFKWQQVQSSARCEPAEPYYYYWPRFDPQIWTSSKKGAATEVFKNLVEASPRGVVIEVMCNPSWPNLVVNRPLSIRQEGTLSNGDGCPGAFAKVL